MLLTRISNIPSKVVVALNVLDDKIQNQTVPMNSMNFFMHLNLNFVDQSTFKAIITLLKILEIRGNSIFCLALAKYLHLFFEQKS